MADTATRTEPRMPTEEPPARDAADVGLLIFASIERIREQIRLERACQRTTMPHMPTIER